MQTYHMFKTEKLDQILGDRRLENEKERQALLQRVMQWLDDHALEYGIHSAYIFGSLSQPYRFHANSDIDLAVEQINATDLFAVIGFLSEAMGRDVDVVQLEKCHFGERIRQTGIQWTATNSSS